MNDYLARRDKTLRRVYGITLDVWNAMYEAQNGRCAICDRNDVELVVDHCHDTNVIRGLLCSNCNTGIGMLQDDPDILEMARDYVRGIRYQYQED